MIAAIRACADMIANFFGWRESVSDNQATHEVIDDKQDLEKACNYAEEAVEVVEQNAVWLEEKHKNKFTSLVKKFRKYK